MDNLEVLFSCSIKIPPKSIIGPFQFINSDFIQLQGILTELYNQIRIVIMKNDDSSYSPSNTTIVFNSEQLKSDIIHTTIYVDRHDSVIELDDFKKIVSEIIWHTMNMIIIERHYPNRIYNHVPSEQPNASMYEKDNSLIIDCHNPIITQLANRIQGPLNKLYEFDDELCISINLTGESIDLPGISSILEYKTIKKTTKPEQVIARLHNGKQSEAKNCFEISLGTSKSKKLTEVNVFPLTEIYIKARYSDEVLIEIFPLLKELRGITSPSQDIEFVKLLDLDDLKKLQLIPPEDHEPDENK